MIPAYSPQARGRCERNFGTWQGSLPQELRLAGSPRWRKPIFSAGTVYRGVQSRVLCAGKRERNRLATIGPPGSGLGIQCSDRSRGGSRQHGRFSGSVLANRKNQMAPQFGRMQRYRSRASGRPNLGALRTPCCGELEPGGHGRKTESAPWKRREPGSRRKPKAGFLRLPYSLGNLAQTARFPLSHRANDYDAHSKERKNQGSLTGQLVCE